MRMIEPESIEELSRKVRENIERDQSLLDEMIADMRTLKSNTRRIQARSATAISLVGTDGGENALKYDPFMVQIVRVVDSSNKQYCLEVVTPATDFSDLNARHFDDRGSGRTPLGRLAEGLGLRKLQDLSPVFKDNSEDRSPSWVQVYREMSEWAVLLELLQTKEFATDTVIVRDGFLRSKMFKTGLFGKLREAIDNEICRHFEECRRRIYIVGIAKHSKVLQKYRLALAIAGVLRIAYPAYVPVPTDLEAKVYKWSEYATGGGEGEAYVAGSMFLVKFGKSPSSPTWSIDIFTSQVEAAPTIFGYLLADCEDGFPTLYYPQCLQRAQAKAAIVDFDMDILQDEISSAIRNTLGDKRFIIDEMALQESDPSRRRYE